MIACVDCGRVLLEISPPHPMASREHQSHAVAQIRTARNLHTCKSTGGFMPTNDHCDTVATLVEQGITTLEEAASVIGCPAPSLHIHLVQHDRDDLLRRLTYGGEPILEPVAGPEPVAASPEPDVEEVEERSCQCDKWVFDDGEEDYLEPREDGPAVYHSVESCAPVEPVPGLSGAQEWPEGTDPQELIDAGLIDPDDVEGASLPDTDAAGFREILEALASDHPSEYVRSHAEGLWEALDEWATERADRMRLEQLVTQRDQLNDEIDRLAKRLGDLPQEDQADEPEPQPEAAAPEQPARAPERGVPQTEIRAWCQANGVPVPTTGRLPRTAIEAYRAAHEVSA